jgi:hypothetical protein
MTLQYSCFVSYSHGQGDLMRMFIEQLATALESSIGPYLDQKVYVDDKRLMPGYNFDEALFKAICQSICMVVVYSPKYEDHVYCLREYTAMERIEMKRKEILGNKASNEVGMIIPIVLRGLQEGLPDKIRKQRHYVDFSKFSTASMNMKRNSKYVKQIDWIAQIIFWHHQNFRDLGEDALDICDDLRPPSLGEIEPWRVGPRKLALPFPGR